MHPDDPENGGPENGGDEPTQHNNAKGSIALYLIGAGALLLIALLAFAY